MTVEDKEEDKGQDEEAAEWELDLYESSDELQDSAANQQSIGQPVQDETAAPAPAAVAGEGDVASGGKDDDSEDDWAGSMLGGAECAATQVGHGQGEEGVGQPVRDETAATAAAVAGEGGVASGGKDDDSEDDWARSMLGGAECAPTQVAATAARPAAASDPPSVPGA